MEIASWTDVGKIFGVDEKKMMLQCEVLPTEAHSLPLLLHAKPQASAPPP